MDLGDSDSGHAEGLGAVKNSKMSGHFSDVAALDFIMLGEIPIGITRIGNRAPVSGPPSLEAWSAFLQHALHFAVTERY